MVVKNKKTFLKCSPSSVKKGVVNIRRARAVDFSCVNGKNHLRLIIDFIRFTRHILFDLLFINENLRHGARAFIFTYYDGDTINSVEKSPVFVIVAITVIITAKATHFTDVDGMSKNYMCFICNLRRFCCGRCSSNV